MSSKRVSYFKTNHCSRVRRERSSPLPQLNFTSPLRKKKSRLKQTRTPDRRLSPLNLTARGREVVGDSVAQW